jgi:hypothetical protein
LTFDRVGHFCVVRKQVANKLIFWFNFEVFWLKCLEVNSTRLLVVILSADMIKQKRNIQEYRYAVPSAEYNVDTMMDLAKEILSCPIAHSYIQPL